MLGFQKKHHLEIGAQFEPGTGGIEPPTFCLQAWVLTNYAKFEWPAHPYKSVCYIATPARPPKSKLQNPKSKIQTGRLDFGFWILDFGSWILDFGFWILDFGFWILDFGSWILDFGFWISDFGFWILDRRSIRSLCGSPKRGRLDFGFWILDFGLWILDFGSWILDFGFWILDFGFWILDLGFWISDFGFWILYTVWILHKIIATTRRLGSADNTGYPFPPLIGVTTPFITSGGPSFGSFVELGENLRGDQRTRTLRSRGKMRDLCRVGLPPYLVVKIIVIVSRQEVGL